MHLDLVIDAPLGLAAARATELVEAGVGGLFTFEGPNDVFFPLVEAAGSAVDLYTNVAVAFPRSPMHLATAAWDLQRVSAGRFSLGLGSQIRAHVERRYSATFDRPIARMSALVTAVQAIFDAWQTGRPVDHASEFYTHTLSPPLLTPPPLDVGPPPIWLAAVGPQMTALAGRVADGIITHPFSTPEHFRRHTLARLPADRAITKVAGVIVGLVSESDDPVAVESAVRGQLGFYGSTPAYRGALDTHGWGDAQPELRQLTRAGDWAHLGDVFDEEMTRTFAVIGPPREVAAELKRRYGALADRLAVQVAHASDSQAPIDLVRAWRAGVVA